MSEETSVTETTQAEAKVKFCEKDSDGTTVQFKFGDGEVMSLDLSSLNEEVQQQLMLHGALQKIGDSYAGAAGDYKYAKDKVKSVMDNLLAGKFNATREGSGESKPKIGEFAQALANLRNLDIEAATQAIEAMPEELRKQVRAHPAIKAEIARLRSEKAKAALEKAGDLSALFGPAQ